MGPKGLEGRQVHIKVYGPKRVPWSRSARSGCVRSECVQGVVTGVQGSGRLDRSVCACGREYPPRLLVGQGQTPESVQGRVGSRRQEEYSPWSTPGGWQVCTIRRQKSRVIGVATTSVIRGKRGVW